MAGDAAGQSNPGREPPGPSAPAGRLQAAPSASEDRGGGGGLDGLGAWCVDVDRDGARVEGLGVWAVAVFGV